MSTTDNLEQKAREWWLSKHPGFYEADERDVNVAVSFARSLAPPPAKELSDEEIEHIVVESIPEMSHVGLAPNDASALKMARAFMERGIRYARDNNYLAPTKEERPVVLAVNVIPDAEAITNDTDLDGHDRTMFELGVRTGLSHANTRAVSVERIIEVVKRTRPITDECPKCDGMGCSGPCPPRYWEEPMRNGIKALVSKLTKEEDKPSTT